MAIRHASCVVYSNMLITLLGIVDVMKPWLLYKPIVVDTWMIE